MGSIVSVVAACLKKKDSKQEASDDKDKELEVFVHENETEQRVRDQSVESSKLLEKT